MSAPRIVIVDDDRQVSHMLRSSLKLTGKGYIIVDVPSAEEALLEVTRGGADLLVTDLRLPGISGLELMEKARKSNPELRSIVVTGHPTEEARNRAAELGVIDFLPKPIRTSRFLEAVNLALEARGTQAATPIEDEKAFIAEWLMTMQRELAAEATLLLDAQGEIIVRAGELDVIDLKGSVGSIVACAQAAVEISRTLGGRMPSGLMHFAGELHDLYVATVGGEYALAIVLPAREGTAQIGAVLQYGRRAAADLMTALYSVGGSAKAKAETLAREEADPQVQWQAVQEVRSMPDEKEQPPGQEPSPPAESEPDLDSAADRLAEQDADKYWDDAARKGDTGPISEDTLTYDEARRRGLLPKDSDE